MPCLSLPAMAAHVGLSVCKKSPFFAQPQHRGLFSYRFDADNRGKTTAPMTPNPLLGKTFVHPASRPTGCVMPPSMASKRAAASSGG
jgi:hypothetical protein